MSSRDTSGRLNTPPLQGRGRGWGLPVSRLDELAGFARANRSNPTEPERRLWRILSGSKLGGFKFRRQAVIGGYIADFLCPQKALIVEVDGDTHDGERDRARDAVLKALGFEVVRFSNLDVMTNIEGVCASLQAELARRADRRALPHPNPSPEGEGLSASPKGPAR